MKISHIGYAVKNIEKAAEAFIRLGYRSLSEPFCDKGRNVSIQFLEKDGYCIELVSPTEGNSPVRGLLEKVGNSPYHICYEVSSIEESIAALRADKYMTLEPPADAPAMGNRRVAFLIHREIGIVELVEGPPLPSP